MKVLITGVDGYLGWPLALHLAKKGHEVAGIDNYLRRKLVGEMGSQSAIPIQKMDVRLKAFHDHAGKNLRFFKGDLTDYSFVRNVYQAFRPECIVFLGQIPSAPYSMLDVHHAAFTQQNNVIGNLITLYAMKEVVPDCHLLKLGTMGEYGTPNVDIPEGFFELEFRGRKDQAIFPRKAGSWYHLSKVHDTHNVEFACRIWGMRATDIMQGVVYGSCIDAMENDPLLSTRFDFDQCFGTAINRFCAQAVIDEPITPFGKGHQKRGFLPLRDSIQCLTLAIENPPAGGEYRVFNQFEEVYNIYQLAEMVQSVASTFDLNVKIKSIQNPRIEAEEHHYKPDHEHLLRLGYKPTHDMKSELNTVFKDLIPHRDRIESRKEAFIPDIRWDGTRKTSKEL